MLDLTKEVKTRSGCKVRIYAQDGNGLYPIHGAFYCEEDQRWRVREWTKDGRSYEGSVHTLDLVNPIVKFRREGYVNVYEDWFGKSHPTKALADGAVSDSCTRIACLKVTLEGYEGEGLE